MPDALTDEAIGEAVAAYIEKAGLLLTKCDGDCDDGCSALWTANAYSQIGQRVKELLAEDLVP